MILWNHLRSGSTCFYVSLSSFTRFLLRWLRGHVFVGWNLHQMKARGDRKGQRDKSVLWAYTCVWVAELSWHERQIGNMRESSPALKLKAKYLLGEIGVLESHIGIQEEIHSCLHLERSQALFAVRHAYGYSLLLFPFKMYIICPHHVYVTIVANSIVFNVTMQEKKNNFKCYFSEFDDNLWVFLFLSVNFSSVLFCGIETGHF